ncbi:teichoic acid biosynthesis protein F [Shewanella sairae]|uniref:Teichoic acid biosynthesis protein F n=1 Tax=Shewanella sairae TaxID=190310 RepID=A0ABQ4PRD7_9GAMM|nr:CDP-glycerol glycerophosphotransferase family protein [Shewanella sairae]MCL1131403.1 CDP-glycerol glycerophosphotransferase family protein [Shewanella sairae]GIU52151.1 teichoic acid biosynthesis protein F [Shewanella sairae]
MTYSGFTWIKASVRKLVYLLSAIAPRSNKKAVFGSYKDQFCDNSKYLYLHWLQTEFIRCIWISGNKELVKQLQTQNREAYYRWSVKGMFHSLTSQYFFYNSYIGDINQWFANGALKVNLWHGLPMKKIEFDIEHGPMAEVFNPQGSFAHFKQKLFAHQQYIKPDLMLSPSPLIDKLFSSAFKLQSKQILRAGFPRTDFYCHQDRTQSQQHKPIIEQLAFKPTKNQTNPSVILYVPSWRDSHQTANPYTQAFDWQQLSSHLVKHNQLFLVRLHPNEAQLAKDFTALPNIINISDFEDVYELLGQVDLLITDYSSLFIDAMPLGIPVCFYRFDEAHYMQQCRDLYPYTQTLPTIAPQCIHFAELLAQLQPQAIVQQKQQYQTHYQQVEQLFWSNEAEDAFCALERHLTKEGIKEQAVGVQS